MPATKNPDLHGNVPKPSSVVLLLIDVINDLEFPGADKLFKDALVTARNIAALKKRCEQAGIACVYVNDNFGRWQSDFHKLIDHCIKDDTRGRPIVELLQPGEKDYFVLKPKHSGFFSTTLDILLDYLKARLLIVTGLTGDNCILFTASDAYMRDFHLWVPSDCVASIDREENAHALRHMKRVLKADVTPSPKHQLKKLLKASSGNAAPERRQK